ncbi:MAG: S41 family peptidase [Bacteroidales bacterium]|nr:S41 family peptidase [Bacteroidales bacterium]
MKKTLLNGVILVTALLTALSMHAVNTESRNYKITKYFEVMYEMLRDLEAYYVDSTDVDKVFNATLEGMLSMYDPYTSYIPEEDLPDFKYMTTGEYAGVGAIISQRDGMIYFSEPYENMPAQKAGILFGDEILSIDGESMEGKTVSYVSDKLKGRPNTELTLSIRREGVKKPLKIKLTRQMIVVPQVVYYGMVAEGIGYIYLESFTDKATQEVRAALLDLKSKGAKKLVLDLRENGGGLMSEAISICNLFVNKGEEIVSTKGKNPGDYRSYKTTSVPVDTLMPLAVIITSGSASSSEIVAGALQDLDRAVIVGERSFGKGLVQATREMPYDGLLKLTTAKYYIPSGRCIQAIDYAHRGEDGRVARIPDSLTTVFHTRNGREVRDGGGIRPDFDVKEDPISVLCMRLVAEDLFSQYANKYFREHERIAPASQFHLTDAEYEDFKKYVIEKGVKYDMRSRSQLDRLKTILKQEGYYAQVEEEMNKLEEKLNEDLQRDLDLFRDDVVKLLESSIVLRYYYQKGEHEYFIQDDAFLRKAVEVLQDDEKYRSSLIVDNQ